ncbi:hypothetical protein Bpfe_010333 [Biomphalaria pfeifferi]|uniref:Uncharacterized protein n=1 Tax=Biomphalaria pfeifferi TaxID=112525 RepID=A0AAD8BSP2_BIOPF|nr:hypothetical protein Bpfe_010333 [Biomphalaria pfeifferi]
MQTRRKKYSVINRPGGAFTPYGPHPAEESPFGNLPVPVTSGRRSVVASVTSTARDGPSIADGANSGAVSLLVPQQPGTSTMQLEPRLQKNSVFSMYQDPQIAGDKIEMRLMVLDESERSQLMHKLVSLFQQKVHLCFDDYKPDLTLTYLKIITSLSALKPKLKARHLSSETKPLVDPFAELDVEEALQRELPRFTISRLRGTVQQLLRHASLRQDGSLYFAGSSEASMASKSVEYFSWFFEFMDYLNELFVNFEEKIFTPLCKYFLDSEWHGGNKRSNTMSSAFSKLSQFSGSDNQGVVEGEHENDEEDDSLAQMRRQRAQAKAALLQLSKEYREIKSLYDTSEIDKVAHRLHCVKDQLDLLLQEEDEVDPDLYSEESKRMVEHLEMDFTTENLMRLVPDILVKLRKAGWLARKWLELDDRRTKDVTAKMAKLADIEERLMKRLDMLKSDISMGERKLEKETNELNQLMEKENRSEMLKFKTYNLDAHIEKLQKKIQNLNKEREQFASQLSEIVKTKNLQEFHKLKYRFEANKLERFVTERKLATASYQKQILSDDINLELYVRPSVIHRSNRLQDDCEKLEKQLREQREELVSIKHALIPVQEDKAMIINKLNRQRLAHPAWDNASQNRSRTTALQPGHALYIRSLPNGRISPGYHQTLLRRLSVGDNRLVSPPAW